MRDNQPSQGKWRRGLSLGKFRTACALGIHGLRMLLKCASSGAQDLLEVGHFKLSQGGTGKAHAENTI